MTKKNYIIIGGTIVLFLIAILIILFTGKKSQSWMDEILKSDNYEITMTDCNNKTVKLPKEAVKELFNRWTELSDNGPWTGNNDICYTKVIISFENNNVIQEREILLVDENTLVLNLNEESKYYTNSSGINNYLNELFTKN